MYRYYITDALKAIGQLNNRYYDIVHGKTVEETRSAEEIIEHLSNGLDRLAGGVNGGCV